MTTLLAGRGPDTARASSRRAPTPVQLLLFFGITFAATWAFFLPFVLRTLRWGSGDGELLQALGVGAPTLTAFVLTAIFAGRHGLGRLLRQGGRWRVGVGWYAFVLAGPGFAVGAGQLVSAALGGQTRPLSLDVDAALAAIVVGLLAGLFEEFGWMGFAFPGLQARFGFWWAGVLMGVAVAVWHLPFFFSPGTTQSVSSFPFFLVQLIAARIVFGWIYNGTGQSVLLAILLHGSWNAWSEMLSTGPMLADPAGLTETGLLCAVVLAVLLRNRAVSRQPQVASPAPLLHPEGRA
jgi:membrane protease YdiL (CAAX protease family)